MKSNKIIIFSAILIFLNIILTESIVTLSEKAVQDVKKLITRNEQLISLKDVSMEDYADCNIDPAIQTWLISYASSGETYFSNQLALSQSAINKCIDVIMPYNSKHLGKDFLRKNQEVMKLKRGAGYWLWKPYLILKTLNKVPDGDIVLYVDSGAYIIKKLNKLFNSFNNKDIIVFNTNFGNKKYIKRYLLQKMDMDNEQVKDTIQCMGSFLVIKNSKVARNIIAEWLKISEDKNALTDSPSDNEYSKFIDHRHDQAILSLLSIKYKENFETLPSSAASEYFHHHRRRSKDVEGPLIEISD